MSVAFRAGVRAFDQGFRSVERKVAAGATCRRAAGGVRHLMRRASEQVGNAACRHHGGHRGRLGWLGALKPPAPEGARGQRVQGHSHGARYRGRWRKGPASVAAELVLRVELAKEAPGALFAEGGDFRAHHDGARQQGPGVSHCGRGRAARRLCALFGA